MKINKLTSALVAVGAVSLAGVAQAQNTYIYLTGSTAARSFVFNALNTSGDVFTGASINQDNCTSGSSDMVFEGSIANVGTVDVVCHWSGSEAGIAAVAGQTLTQPDTTGVPGSTAGQHNLPGVPPAFAVGPIDGGNWTTTHVLDSAHSGGRGITTPDLSMADTSQAVSQTSQATFPLTDYGPIAVVPFTFEQGYAKTPYTTLSNITTAAANQIITGEKPASTITGNTADLNTLVVLCGRNKGSGTRANALLNIQHGIDTPVSQYSFDATYVSDVLTFNADGNGYAPNQTIVAVGNDGYDSGGGVQQVMNTDGTGAVDHNGHHVVVIGYLGISDAQHAYLNNNAGSSATAGDAGDATPLEYNGVYESDTAVENGTYTYWGTEHLLGSIGQSSTSAPGYTGTALANGIAAALIGQGAATGALGPGTPANQSILIPKGLMQVSRSGSDSGFPAFVGAGNF